MIEELSVHHESLVARSWAKISGAPLVAILAGVVISAIYLGWLRYKSPAKERAQAIAKCHEDYAKAASHVDSARVDAEVVIWRVARTTTRDVSCEELRISADW